MATHNPLNGDLMLSKNYLLLPLFLILFGCGQTTDDAPAAVEKPTPAYGTWGVDLSARDETIKPGDDFFSYANGSWLKANEIPAERSSYGVGLIVHEQAQERVKTIIEELSAASGEKGSPEQKVGDYYASWMNANSLNELGITPLKPDLTRIQGIETANDLTAEFGRLHYIGGISPISHSLGIDPADPNKYLSLIHI